MAPVIILTIFVLFISFVFCFYLNDKYSHRNL